MIWFLPAERRYIFVRGVDAWKRGRGGYLGARYYRVATLEPSTPSRGAVCLVAVFTPALDSVTRRGQLRKCVTLAGAFQLCDNGIRIPWFSQSTKAIPGSRIEQKCHIIFLQPPPTVAQWPPPCDTF